MKRRALCGLTRMFIRIETSLLYYVIRIVTFAFFLQFLLLIQYDLNGIKHLYKHLYKTWYKNVKTTGVSLRRQLPFSVGSFQTI